MTRMALAARMNRYYVAVPPTLAAKCLFVFKEVSAVFIAVSILALVIVVGGLALNNFGWLFVAILIGAGLAIGVPYVWAMKILHPTRSLARITPSDVGISDWEDVRFLSPDGIELHGWFIAPPPASDGATIIFVHGLGSNRSELLDEAAMLIDKGYGALLFDLRNHGASRGKLSTLGFYEANDVWAAVNYLSSRKEVNRERIALMGHSMGGVAILRAAPRLPHIKAVVAESAFTSLEDNIIQGVISKTGLPPFPFAPLMVWLGERITGVRMNQLRPIDNVAQIAPRPVLFIHGAQDTLVQVSNSVKLFEACHKPKGLYVIPQASHAQLLSAAPQQFSARVVGFMDWAVRGIDRREHPRADTL